MVMGGTIWMYSNVKIPDLGSGTVSNVAQVLFGSDGTAYKCSTSTM